MKALRFLVIALAIVGVSSVASAQLFMDDFESYAAGTDLQNVGGWKGWNGDAGASAPVSDAFAFSGSNSVEIVPAADLVHEYDIAGGKWVFSAMQYIPSGTTGTSYFIVLNSYDDNANQDWSVQTLFNLAGGTLNSYYVAGSDIPIVYDEWVEVKLVIDLDENTVDEYYNGVEFASHQWDDNDHGTIGAIDLFGNGASSVYYDDIMIQSYIEYTARATAPSPAKQAIDVPRDVVLSWTAGSLAATHDVYFGTVYDDVSAADRDNPMGVLASRGQAGTTFDPDGLLDFSQTYYWRVDEVSAAPDNTIFKGEVWTFTAEPLVYPVQNIIVTTNMTADAGAEPENTVNGSGLNENDEHSIAANAMWLGTPGADTPYIQFEFDLVYKLEEMLIWNYNGEFEMFLSFGIKDVTVEYSTDGTEWTVLGDVELAQGTARSNYTANTTVDFGGIAVKSVRLTINSGYGMFGQYGLSEVRFIYTPAQARDPQPADGATGVNPNGLLSWRVGRQAASHEVYVSADEAAVADGSTLAGTVTDNSFSLEGLDLQYGSVTYYWKVNEVNEAEAISTWEGGVWSFTTTAYGVIDDFESYDEQDNRVYETWIDGWENDTGSTVGHDLGPFVETEIVHGGGQSMPLFYDNAGLTTAEAEYTFAAQNWAANGIQTLSLYFCGAAGNTGQLYVKINNTRVDYDGDAADIGIAGWQKWSIVLANTGANLSNVTKLTIGIEGAGATGVVYIDDIRLSPEVSAPRTSDIRIAISAQANWWSQNAADREIEEIVDNAQAPVVVFDAGSQDGLADWLSDHTSNGVANLLILCGQLPDTIYGPGNVQADDSIVEQFLDAGNTIINTGDWIFYVVNGAGTNGEAGLQTIMDIPGVTVAGEDNTAVTVTAEGQAITPSLQDFATDRPFHLDTLEGDWYAELILAQDAGGTLADPVIVRNSATGGRIGVFHQAASEDNLPRGEVMSEWINNWYLDAASGN